MPSPMTGATGGPANPTPGTSMPSLLLHAVLHPATHTPGSVLHASGCVTTQCHPGTRVLAFPIVSPIMNWLGGEASKAVGDVWQAAMTGLWSAALWLLQLAFQVIDQFTTPDLSASGPMSSVLPTTLWIGGAVAVLMMFIQLAVALVRRDGQSLGRVFLGIAQFGAAWIAYLGVAGGLVAAAAGLEKGILSATLHVNSFSGINLSASWPRNVNDVVLATVLGVLSLLLVIPAAFFYLIIMFVREAALILLVATAPISAAGLLADASKVWFWKSLRWFIACLLISPTAALVLGIGVQVSAGVVSGEGDKTAAAAGMAVVGCIMIAIGACCPLVLFRLLAFVDPSTASGVALRQSFSDAGGMSGLMTGNGAQAATGGTAAAHSGSDGRSGGETNAESQTRGRLAAAMGAVGQGMQTAVSLAHKAADVGSDVLGSTGVGHPGYSLTPTDTRATRQQPANSASTTGGGDNGGGGEAGGNDDGASTPPPAGDTPPSGGPGVSAPSPLPSGPGGPGIPGGPGDAAGGGAAAGGGEAAAAAVAL